MTWRRLSLLALLCLTLPTRAAVPANVGTVDFNRDIRPILSDRCYACHGPDEAKRKSGLRLDNEEGALALLKSGERAIVRGADHLKSGMLGRITTKDEEEVMPPPKFGKPLTGAEVDLLTRWIKRGAEWQKHWSFIPPVRPELPVVKDRKWPRNAVDRFILARLEKDGIKPAAETDKATLIRRVTFDLTGLPPTIAEVDAFLADRSSDAYEKLVDRLLASPHYGERLAQNWLDLSRYADTSGYHFDGVRFMWLWRDWVINAFNENKPFDSFTIEQLAGDLMPEPTQSQRLATGFVRNNMTNDEGGADPDEYLNKYVVDRVNTVGAVWLGLTVGCTECHDHKYDPMTTKEFYRLYAFFHNVPEKGLDRIRTDNPPPRLPVPTPEQAVKFVEADFRLKDAEKTLADRTNELGETQEKWEREAVETPPTKPSAAGLRTILSFDETLDGAAPNGAAKLSGKFTGTNKAEFGEGRIGNALKLDGKAHVELEPGLSFDRTNTFSYGAWIKFQGKDGTVLSRIEKEPAYRGYDLLISESKLELHLVSKWPDDALKVRTKEVLPANQWLHVFATHDGSGKAAGVKLYVNGKLRDVEVQKDQLKGSITNAEPIRIGSRNAQFPFTGSIDDVRVYDRVLSSDDVGLLVLDAYVQLIHKSRGQRSADERSDLSRYYKENHAIDFIRAERSLAEARKSKDGFYTAIPSSLIMEEMQPPRDTFVFVRGDFRTKGEKVTAATPAFLPALPPGPTNRLTLARWLVSKEQPLAARVTVNRYWGMLFGNGLVKTANDFGSQGEWPSHPELLDWLAVQFRDGGPLDEKFRPENAKPSGAWDVKALIRLMVTSAAYRQSAAVSPEKLEKDPYNRLLTRGPRVRLDAEFIRDNALAVSGLLNSKIGGASVKPYQPPGIWDGVDAAYKQDKGGDLYRRGLYVFWRRSAHYPSFATFDAPNREVCTFLRQRTQTPLQSLVLMNDPSYVEAARGLAQRVFAEAPADLNRRLVLAFRHTLGRPPLAGETALLKKTFDQQLANFQGDPKAAEALLKVGESPAPTSIDKTELAAMTAVANVLLNLNETITK